ncbi:hypothetical protein QOZ80_1BG0063830 [Eleusine coracana subsp. coracana]|nr:hypothetical protein QOZ80_1BG0063830 [Eleusine coracana subsp. coracana]
MAVELSPAQYLPRATTRTASTCTAATTRGTHVFKIADYSLHKGLGPGKFIRSATFPVGGYDWCVRYYPDGDGRREDGSRGELALHLELMTKNSKVRAQFEFLLVDQSTTGEQSFLITLDRPRVFNAVEAGKNVLGTGIMNSSDLEQSPYYLRDDCLVFHCDVIVVKEPMVSETPVASKVQVPPSCLLDNLRELLETGEGADVIFKVKGEAIPAHKIILAMQSPVFKAELYGPMMGNTADSDRQDIITVEDMEPDVFKALRTYIYTDSLPSMDDLEGADKEEMVKHLLVAADRYGGQLYMNEFVDLHSHFTFNNRK